MTRIAIFASGTGSNAEQIIHFFDRNDLIEVGLIVSNRASAPVLDLAERHEIPSLLVDRQFFYETNQILFELAHRQIDLVVLAGFLWLVPAYLVQDYRRRIINIHPALLPKFGGKGMYGMHVHQAVKDAGEVESGITIHYVNEVFDDGTIIFQARVAISSQDTAEQIGSAVLQLEHRYYPRVIEKLIREGFNPTLPMIIDQP